MRLAMLTGRKFTALVNNYSARDETIKKLEKLAAVNMFDFAIKNNLIFIKENYSKLDEKALNAYKNFHVPTNLKIYCFDNGNVSRFPSPTLDNDLFGKKLEFKSFDLVNFIVNFNFRLLLYGWSFDFARTSTGYKKR